MPTKAERDEEERARARAGEARALVLAYLADCRRFKLTPSPDTFLRVTWLGDKERPWNGITSDEAKTLARAVYADVTAEQKRREGRSGGPGAQLPDPPLTQTTEG